MHKSHTIRPIQLIMSARLLRLLSDTDKNVIGKIWSMSEITNIVQHCQALMLQV
jgi:hypothetical protein